MTQIIQSIEQWRTLRRQSQFKNKKIGFVPTMGNLHAGHQSLLTRCRQENQIAILSIFVNPTQFNDKQDYQNYPSTLAADIALAQELNIDYILQPDYNQLYPDHYSYQIIENNLSKELCGEFRPGHFAGMLTIVLKLLQLTQPDQVYFGEKDYQQLLLIEGMVNAFFLDCKIIPCPTIRDQNGLALSSRNRLLSAEHTTLAPHFPRLLSQPNSLEAIKKSLTNLGFEVEYITEYGGRRFGAVRLGSVRLIDNMPIVCPQSS